MATHSHKWDVFISHNRRQKVWVRQMVEQLRDLGLQVFFDEDSIPPGADVLKSIEQGVEKSLHLIFIITPSSVASEWVSLETSLALYRNVVEKSERLIPLLLEKTPEADIRLAIRGLNRIDLTDLQTRTIHYNNLLTHLGVEGALPAPPQWEQSLRQINAQVENPLQARRTLRVPLTDIACLFYQEACAAKSFLVGPQGMPVLSHENFLPDTPVSISEVNKRLVWIDKPELIPQHHEADMVGILRSQSPAPQIYDGPLYRFLGQDGQGFFRFCPGSYFGFLNSCDYLSLELAKAITDNSFAYDILLRRDRSKYLQIVSILRDNPNLIPMRLATDPLDFTSRYTAFGTCALVIVKRTNKSAQMILNLRSSALTETPDLLHVIPAGTFQPNMSGDRFHNVEFSFTENLVREFAEELLDAEDLRRPRVEPLDVDAMYSKRGKRFRQNVVRGENYSLFYLGTVVDPVNLKPEILTVLLIHDGFLLNIDKNKLVTSWESGRLSFHEFNEDEINYLIGKSNFVPTGKAHLMLVKKHFHFLCDELSKI